MLETFTIDVTNVMKILKCCPYYDDIINSDTLYGEDDDACLIDWYRDLIFSCNGDDEDDIKMVRDIDRCMYIYVNDRKYRKGLKKRIINDNIDLNGNVMDIMKLILSFTNYYEEEELLNITSTKWI